MNKQTVLWTMLPFSASQGTHTEVGVLHFSVFLSPQLWCDERRRFLTLSGFPDFLDLPQKINQASFTVEFDDGPTLFATRAPLDIAKPDKPSSELWKALFNDETIVLPYRFPDYTAKPLVSYSAIGLLDYLNDLYQRIGSDPHFGAGANYPTSAALAHDDALIAIETPEHKKARHEKAKNEAIDEERQRNAFDAMLDERWRRFERWKLERSRPSDVDLARRDWERLNRRVPRNPETPRYQELQAREPFQEIEGKAQPRRNPSGTPDDPELTPQMEEWAKTFEEFHRFHQPGFANVRPQSQRDLIKKLHGDISTAELEQVFDFHRALALLANYPRLMRLLGLVVDLTVPREMIPAEGRARVVAKWKSSLPTLNYSLRTEYKLDDSRFQAKPKTNLISNGLLHLTNIKCVVAQVDVDGAAFKLSNLAGDLQNALTTPQSAEPSSLPALRSGGIALLRPDPIESLKEKFGASADLAKLVEESAKALTPTNQVVQNAPRSDQADVVSAEMLVRAYRVKVFDDSAQKWHSLHRRVGKYEFVNRHTASQDLTDEGFSQLSVTKAPDGREPDLLVHEALAVWNGWSLSAPRPGKAIANADEGVDDGGAKFQESNLNRSATEFGLQATFSAEPGSLPRLRFGHNYRLRVDVVDLAGNSVSGVDDKNPALAEATPGKVYKRFEPVSSPFLVPQGPYGDGESLERLVIRSGSTLASADCARHVVPPKTAQFLAEMHGKFDDGNVMARTQGGYDLASREAGTLDEIHETTTISPLPYLPDPFARGALLLGLPGLAPSSVIPDTNKLEFTGKFPDLRSFRLVLQDGNGAPTFESASSHIDYLPINTLKVFLPPGETARVRLASFLTADDLEQMGVWQWIEEKKPDNFNDLLQQAQDGRHWMITPYRTLLLVHAVAQPLESPRFKWLVGDRQSAGESSATIKCEVTVDRKSTAQLDVFAEWADPIDNPSDPNNDPAKDVLKHTSPVGDGVDVPFGNSSFNTVLGVIPASSNPVEFELSHQLNDTKYHRVKYRATATTRFRDYFVHEIDNNNLQITCEMEAADWRELEISSSTRPAAPQVVYVVPTFRWQFEPGRQNLEREVVRRINDDFEEVVVQRTDDNVSQDYVRRSVESDGTRIRKRYGGGLRVYLERPWFSSGAGELLGVVFQQKPFADVSALAQPRVTKWGMDPLWNATAPPLAPSYDHFKGYEYPLEPINEDSLTLDEMGEAVSVAAYPVEYDHQRGLWFSDIEISASDTYFPFVRLALARCQPHSLHGVELSRVVLADFTQLTPDRSLTVKTLATRRGTTKLHITLNGPTYEADDQHPANEIGIRLQESLKGVPSDLGWRDVESGFAIEQDTNMTGLWSGEVSITENPDRPHRLVILETDRLQGSTRRPIYADLITLPIE
jgi:hypothetical protein